MQAQIANLIENENANASANANEKPNAYTKASDCKSICDKVYNGLRDILFIGS